MADTLSLAYLGAGPFALPPLRALFASPHEVVAVVTQPDRAAPGRRRHVNPVKEAAVEAGVPVFQPERIADEIAAIAATRPDVLVTASYGQYLGPAVRGAAPQGAINLHGSLLPRYRGAAPVQHTVWNRDVRTGVTAFQIGRGMDTGPILGVVETDVQPQETYGELLDRLAELAGPLAIDVCAAIAGGGVTPRPQDDSLATDAPKLTKDDGLIDWSQRPERVQGQVLATQPWPKPTTFWHRQPDESTLPNPARLGIVRVVPADGHGEPGEVIDTNKQIVVATGDGAVRVDRIQLAGKPPMRADAFLNGYPLRVGDRFAAS